MDTLELAIVDLETTGTSAMYDRIIEVGVLRISKGKVVETFSTLVDPERPISSYIERLTGIGNKDVAGAPVFREIRDRLLELLDGAVLVAHNARFDYGFLKREFEREHIDFSATCLCTARLSRMLFPEHRRHNLDSIIERFAIDCANRHRAFGDAAVLWEFIRRVKGVVDEGRLKEVLAAILKIPTLPPLLPESVVAGLPEGLGVYIFYGQAGEALYVGRGVNIRDRVLSHFLKDRRSVKEAALYRRTADITAIRTSGELGALLREAALIRELAPLFNRRSAGRKRLTAGRTAVDDQGYTTVLLEPLDACAADDVRDIVGIFTSRRQARDMLWSAVREHGLCPKRLHLEKGAGPCSYTQLGTCRGACVSAEAPAAYNARASGAFEATRLDPWPFSGPILIEEKEAAGDTGEVFAVDQWKLLAWYAYDACGVRRLHDGDRVFHYEHYRVLQAYITDGGRRATIRPITQEALDALCEAAFGVSDPRKDLTNSPLELY
jgi:DNA polymerase-3 subunit epsilon